MGAKRATLESKDEVIRDLRKALRDLLTFAPDPIPEGKRWVAVKVHVDDLARAQVVAKGPATGV